MSGTDCGIPGCPGAPEWHEHDPDDERYTWQCGHCGQVWLESEPPACVCDHDCQENWSLVW